MVYFSLINFFKGETMSQNSLREKFLTVWEIAHKFSGGNSKITKKIESYIKENFLEDTFSFKTQSGAIKTLPVFELAEPRNGKQTPYFNPAALEYFSNFRGPELKSKAIEFEEECPTIPLRMLRRKLGIAPAKEQALLKFIETKCLHDTFMLQDETGAQTEELIFDYPMDNHSKTYLCVQKKGIIPFVQAHEEELKKIGAKNTQILIDKIPDFKKEEGLLQQNDIFKALRLANPMRMAFSELFFNHLIHQQKQAEQKGQIPSDLFLKRKSRLKTHYCLKEEDLPILILQNEKELKAIGLTQAVIDHFINQKKISKKTKNMITLSEFARHFLHSNKLTDLLKEIRQYHLNDTYQTQDETGALVQKQIFIKVGARKDDEKNYVFASKEALKAFARQNKELLLKHLTLFQYENIFRGSETCPPEGEAVLVMDLIDKYHFFGRNHFSKIASYLNETFTSCNSNGEPEEKPLIYLKREENGYLKYHILKEAILTLLTRHQKELKVQNTTLKAILRNKPILLRTDSMLSMENITEFLGQPRHLYPKIASFIEKNCQDEQYYNPETNKKEDCFVYAMCQSGKISLMIEAKAVQSFISNHQEDLKEIGFEADDIKKALSASNHHASFQQKFVAQRRLRQDAYNERARSKKEHTKE